MDGEGEMVEDATKTSMMVKTTGIAKMMEEKAEEMRTVGKTMEDATTGEAVAIAGGKRSGLKAAEPRVLGGRRDVYSTPFSRWWKLAGAFWICGS